MALLHDIWVEIVKYVQIDDFKSLSLTCVLFHQLITPRRIKLLRILWKWRNKTRNPSLNLNEYINHRVGSTVTFKNMVDGCLEYFIDKHLTKLPNFLKKTIKYTNARKRIRFYRARYKSSINYQETDRKLMSCPDIYEEFDDIENGSYSDCMIKLILIIHALGIENSININAICNDRSTKYVQRNPHFVPDFLPYQERFQQIKNREDVQYRLSTML